MTIVRTSKAIALSVLIAGSALAGPGGGPGGGSPGGGPPGPVSSGPIGMQRVRPQIQATEQDRLRIRGTLESSANVRNRAREMRQAALGEGYGRAQAREHRDRIRNELQALERRHADFAGGLAPAERDRIQDRLRDMDQIRDRTRDRLRALDAECDATVPDRDRLREHAREIAREMKTLRDRYRDLGIE